MEFMAGSRGQQYPAELRERAVRMVAESRPDHGSEWEAMRSVASKLGIGTTETVRKWVRRAEVDGGVRPGVTSEESAEMRKLRTEVRELRRANEILKAAAGFFAAELDRPQRF
jgi:transposase